VLGTGPGPALVVVLWIVASYWSSSSSAGPHTPASNGVMRGVVTDSSGNPLRGATVTVTIPGAASVPDKWVSRYTDENGRYEIKGLRQGPIEVSAKAFGKETKTQMSETGQANFTLQTGLDPDQLSSSEWSTLFMDHERRFMVPGCSCHGLNKVTPARGLSAKEWERLIITMGAGVGELPMKYSDETLAYMTGILEKYLGPNAVMPTPEQINHVPISDEALGSTITEWASPGSMNHSMTVDLKGRAWFTQYFNNKIARFDPVTETLTEYPLPWKKAGPHTSWVDPVDGSVWTALSEVNYLVAQDPETGKITSYPIPADVDPIRGHTVTMDSKRNVWMSATFYDKILKFDRKTEKFEKFEIPSPSSFNLDDTAAAYMQAPGEPPKYPPGTYDIAVDSNDKVWYSYWLVGLLARLDPVTGQSEPYKFPGVRGIKGVAVDHQDNVWFAAFDSHKLGKYDQKTGQVKLYQPPTPYATPYGLVIDKQGNVWFGDSEGDNITKFDPHTEKFVEYRIPTVGGTPRFIGVDNATGRVWFTESFGNKFGVLDPGATPTPSL